MVPLRGDVPTRRLAVITVTLITLHVVVHLPEVLVAPQTAPCHLYLFGLISWEVTHGAISGVAGVHLLL